MTRKDIVKLRHLRPRCWVVAAVIRYHLLPYMSEPGYEQHMPKVEVIVEYAGLSKRTVCRALRELRQAKFIN